MKFTSIIIIFFSIQAHAQSVDGSMVCTVTGNVVVASEEGKFKTYPNIEGGVKANERLILDYRVTNNSIFIELRRDQPGKNTVINDFLSSSQSDISAEKGKNGGFIFSQANSNHSVSFLPDYIRINQFQELFLSRYYKNDWHGIYTYVSRPEPFTQTLTLNCRHTNDKMDAAFKLFTGYKEQK